MFEIRGLPLLRQAGKKMTALKGSKSNCLRVTQQLSI
jgi:hypothetical protein